VSAVTLIMGIEATLAADIDEFTTVTDDADVPLYMYASSWCDVMAGQSVVVELQDLTVGSIPLPLIEVVALKNYEKTNGKQFKNAVTPKRKTPGKTATLNDDGDKMYEVAPATTKVSIKLASVNTDDWHTVHVRLKLDNGELLGVNLHSMPCEVTELTPGAT